MKKPVGRERRRRSEWAVDVSAAATHAMEHTNVRGENTESRTCASQHRVHARATNRSTAECSCPMHAVEPAVPPRVQTGTRASVPIPSRLGQSSRNGVGARRLVGEPNG